MILFLSNADTELLAAASIAGTFPHGFPELRWAHVDRVAQPLDVTGVDLVVVRLLGGRSSWEEPFEQLHRRCRAEGVALVALGGEAGPDADLVARSTVAAGVATELHRYLAAGGPDNLAQGLRFAADTVLFGGFGFEPPRPVPHTVVFDGAGIGAPGATRRPDRPLAGVVFYRAHLVAGNTTYVAELCDALDAAGLDAVAVATYSLRADAEGRVPALDRCRELGVDVLVTTVLAAGASSGEGGDDWEVPELARLGVPVVQAPASSRSRQEWAADDAGLSPLDVAMGVAIPEFDGRIIGPTFAFKEVVDGSVEAGDAVTATKADPERAAALARLVARLARLRRRPPAERRVAVVLTAYPTKRSRLGNAVGLDTPASVIDLLHRLRAEGYHVEDIPADGDTLMAALADSLTYDQPELGAAQLAASVGRLDAARYAEWFATLPADAAALVEQVWGPGPGSVYVHDGALVMGGLMLGNVLVAIQPPRGFGSDPIGTYHAPDVPPPHHYLAFYRWLDEGWGADAIVHAGKHGTLEWLPGKATALSAGCFPDAALGAVPLVYPFVVNDPGEGTQAKRRAHAVVIDHLPPPLTRADAYDDLARLEQLLDTYAQVQSMDPAKLPAVRRQVWELLVEAEVHRDLDLGDAAPDEDAFDDLLLHVDGYLCALKDAQIRGGLHVLGRAPTDDALVDTVLAVTRLPQGEVPSLRATMAARLGVDAAATDRRTVDRIEAACRVEVERLAAARWRSGPNDPAVSRWIGDTLVPALERTTDEVDRLLDALDGRYVPSGPSGAPSRGQAHVLPTGRNFYSVDPKSIPSPLAWEVGRALADRLVERHVSETGVPPRTVGLVLWGTAAMRTAGDDVAEALALLGVRPQWEPESRRVVGLEPIPLDELGRPRIDVTLRISGFFRDAFPHVIALLDDAVHLVAGLDEPAAANPVREAGAADPRLYGPPPGGYGSGILPVIESRAWRTSEDLADVYLAWSGFAYGRHRHGEEAAAPMRRRFAAIEVAVKNQDNREHDIFDSDDYLQDHGGMVAAVRSLSGREPRAWFGDSADPANPRVRSLAEEAARVVRSRVINPKWIAAMQRHGYKGALELAATVDYLFGYDATARVVEDWMYERVTRAYVADPEVRKFFQQSNPWALRSVAERLLEADQRGMWQASDEARAALRDALLEAEGWEEGR